MSFAGSSVAPNNDLAAEIYSDGTYLANNPTWHVEDSLWKATQIHKLLMRNRLLPASICEVGCGAGEVLRQISLLLPQARCTGYELSAQAFDLCKSRTSSTVSYVHGDLLLDNTFYDALLCVDVFEHVDDYLGFIRSLKSKSAYAIFHIPIDISVASILRNTLMDRRRMVGHLHYFTAPTALATIADCGYEVIDSMYTPSFNLTNTTRKSRIAKYPRTMFYAISPRWLTTTLGGCSLLVLAK